MTCLLPLGTKVKLRSFVVKVMSYIFPHYFSKEPPFYYHSWGFPGGANGKESSCQCRRHERCRFYPWIRRSLGVGNGNALQYSCLRNPMDREAWWTTVHGVAKSQTKWST